MKIKVSDLKPNPFRNTGKYPIDREKVEDLKASIQETGFWNNFPVRERNGKYEIPHGHHRLAGLQELGIVEVDLPVWKISDENMIKMMVIENMPWAHIPSVMFENVRIARSFIDDRLEKYDTWEELQKKGLPNVADLFEGHTSKEGNPMNPKMIFGQAKAKGAGRNIILRFLGKACKRWMVEDALKALDLIKEKIVDEEAVESLPTMRHVREFTKAIKKDPLPAETQRKISKEISEDENNYKPSREIYTRVINEKHKPLKRESKEEREKRLRNEKIMQFEDFVRETNTITLGLINRMREIDQVRKDLGPNLILDKMESIKLTASLEILYRQLHEILTDKNKLK